MSYVVAVTLEFTTPCLGNERREDPEPNRMLRASGEGRYVFLQTWWHGCTTAAAERFSKHQKRIRAVKWASEVEGSVSLLERFYYRNDGKHVKLHEGFPVGGTIVARAIVPDDIPIGDFSAILSMAGEFFGISPFGWKRGYGRFKVLEVTKAHGKGQSTAESEGEPHRCVPDNTCDTASPGTGGDIPVQGE